MNEKKERLNSLKTFEEFKAEGTTPKQVKETLSTCNERALPNRKDVELEPWVMDYLSIFVESYDRNKDDHAALMTEMLRIQNKEANKLAFQKLLKNIKDNGVDMPLFLYQLAQHFVPADFWRLMNAITAEQWRDSGIHLKNELIRQTQTHLTREKVRKQEAEIDVRKRLKGLTKTRELLEKVRAGLASATLTCSLRSTVEEVIKDQGIRERKEEAAYNRSLHTLERRQRRIEMMETFISNTL